MDVKGLSWLGLRTTQFEEMVTFFRDVMGMQPIRDEPEIVGFQMIDGTQMELYRPEEEFHAFFTTGPVVAFRVENVEAARTTMEAAGIEFLALFSVQVRRVGIIFEPRTGLCLRY